MAGVLYSAEQVADILGLHVRTVRSYVREGRLAAVRMGKQYRISERSLREFTGSASDEPSPGPHARVSSVVHIDNVDRVTMDRLTAHLGAAALGGSGVPSHLDIHSTFDEAACRLTVFVVGNPNATAAALGLIDALTRQDTQ